MLYGEDIAACNNDQRVTILGPAYFLEGLSAYANVTGDQSFSNELVSALMASSSYY